jgi:hypothetical protein
VDAHPTNADVVYINNEAFFRSDDGGRTLVNIPTPHGDNHDMWFNPDNPDIFIQSNDGGANVTFNGGETWSTQYNQPTAEFYTVAADNQFPYRLYAPQQDNTTISVPSRVTRGLTPFEDWFRGPGCETGPITVDPRNSDILYGACKGWMSRLDRSTNQLREIWLWPQEPHALPNAELKFREQWVSQLRFSPHDASVLYHTSQYVHISRNEGQDWEVISPDLTRWEEHKHLHVDQPGGPLTYDQTGVEVYGTVFAFEESPHQAGLFWAGSDDGAVHISTDAGANWEDITPPGLQLHSTVNEIVLSPHAAGRAFAVVQRYRMDDFHPYIYRTDDFGSSWALLTDGTNGIPADHATRSLQEDHVVQGLLYAGTEFGVFVSFDDGAHWQPFQQNLPRTPVMDLLIKDDDLVVATQGRALWIMDDLTPLHQIDAAATAELAYLFAPRPAYRVRLQGGGRGGLWAENPPDGAAIHYAFGDDVRGEVTMEIRDASGDVVRIFTSSGPGTKEEVFQAMREPTVTLVGSPRVQTEAGMHRLVWDLEYPPAYLAPGVHEGVRRYTVTLSTEDGWSQTQDLEVVMDPRVTTPMSDLQEQFDLAIEVRDRITEIQLGVAEGNERLRELDAVIAEGGSDAESAAATKVELEDVLSQLYKHGQRGDHAHLRPQLTTDYAAINSYISGSENRPPSAAYPRMEELDARFQVLMGRLRTLLEGMIA